MSRIFHHFIVYLILGVLVLAPICSIVYEALQPDAIHQHGVALFQLGADRDFINALSGTLGLSGFAVLFAIPLGLALALLMYYAPPKLAPFWEALILIPFLIPPYLTAEAWSLLVGPMGLIKQVIHLQGHPLESFLYSLAGMGAVIALHLTPLVYIMIRASLENSNYRLWQAARVHGAGIFSAFRLAILPLLLPALAASALLVFLDTSAEFGVPALLGSYAGVSVLSVSIEEATNVWPINLPRAAAIGLVLCAMGIAVWFLYRPLVQDNRGQIQRQRLPQTRWWSILPISLFGGIGTFLPMSAIIAVSCEQALSNGLRWNNLTWRHYHHVLSHQYSAFSALQTSLQLSALVAVAGMGAALLAANIVRRGGRIATLVDLFSTLPMAIPGVVLAVGIILFWNAPWNHLPVYGHTIIMAVAYATLTFPFAFRYAQTGLAQIPPRLEQAGRVHGASPWHNALRIQLPLVWPMLVGGATVVFALSMRDLVAPLILQPAGTQVISTYIYENFLQGSIGDGMAMSVIGIFITALILGLARRALIRR